MTQTSSRTSDEIRIAMLGMVEGNGHPFSWSAIINGDYDPAAMALSGYPGILQYLSAEPRKNLGIAGARVTHVWCDNPKDAEAVSRASKVQHVVTDPLEVIGEVDAVVIATDIGSEHLERARPFIERDIPVFIDKPMTDRADHLKQFIAWHRAGKRFMSSSCMRYCKEFAQLREKLSDVGEMRLITVSMTKSFERYGIHALEAVYPFLPAGAWRSVANSGNEKVNIVHLRHASGVDVVIEQVYDIVGSFGCLTVHGTKAFVSAKFTDTFFAFKAQLIEFVEYVRTGRMPFAFDQTVELMKMVIGGLKSRAEGGREVMLNEIEG